jgi:DNA-binding protein HU-beta
MNKGILIDHLANKVGLTKKQAEEAVNQVFGSIASSLKKKQDARFVGFGTFSVSKRKARTGRNPRTGESIKIPARNVVKFSAGKEFKEMVN